MFHLVGQTRDGSLIIKVGDATRDIAVRPLHRPEMKELAARVELPAYLGYPAVNQPIQGGAAEFLEGSSVSFSGKTSRKLQTATMKLGEVEPPAAVLGETFVTVPKPVAEIGAETSFRWADTHSLSPAQPYMLHVSTTKDADPRVELQGIEPELAILPHEILKLTTMSSDDFGLKETWLGWTTRALTDKKSTGKKAESAHTAGAQTKKELTTESVFSPAMLKIPEDSVVELAAYASDYFPGRAPVESWRHTIYVLSPGKHAERVQDRMDQVLKQLDERIRDEERQLEETKGIQENKTDLPTEKAAEETKKVEAGERANEAALKKMQEEMKEVMKDALRNKDIPEKTVAEWQQLAEKLEKNANPPMQQAAENMQQAAQQPGKREEELKKAQEQQQKALDAMKDVAKQMNKTNENLYARNFYNRMRAAAAAESKLSESLKGLAKETAGLKLEEIVPQKVKEFTQAADRQMGTTKDVDSIVNDMAAFVKRVPNEKYELVQKEMQDKKVVAELTELAGYVRMNLGLKSVGRAKLWSAQLEQWATMLQDECKSNGGGGGEMDPDIMEFMISMVRTAVAQDGVREQTVLVEEKKAENTRYAEDAGRLATQQDDVRGQLGALLKKITFDGLMPNLNDPLAAAAPVSGQSKFAKFQPVIEKTLQLAGGVSQDLREPRTDGEVSATQSAIIELLVPPDKKGGSSSSPQAKMQQMMQQMMAQATGKKAGGNNSKSDSSFVGDTARGEMAKTQAAARHVEKAGGAVTAEWPEEFRDQLQSFFQQVEGAPAPK